MAEGLVGLSLRVDGGGVWQLDDGTEVHALVNRRVQVEGVRSGFDMLEVTKISPIDVVGGKADSRPSRPARPSRRFS